MRDLRQCGDIEHLGKRIRRGLDEDQFRLRPEGRPERRCLAGCDERGLDAELRQNTLEQLLCGSEHPPGRNDVLACPHERHDGRQNGGHAARRGNAGLAPFQSRQTFLQHADGGIGEAAIDEAGFLPGETGSRLGSVIEYEARGEVERLCMLVELAAPDARPHGQRIQIEFLVHFFHGPTPKIKNPAQLSDRVFPRFSRIY